MSARILVVDDLLPNIKLLEAKLSSEYYNVLTAKSGPEAIKALETNSIDLVLLDVMMPDMDGFETCRKIKVNPKTAHIPVVMVTALSDIDDRVSGLNAGADDFLTKPINETALFARIKSLLRLKTITDELRIRNKSLIELGLDTEDLNLDKSFLPDSSVVIYEDDIAQINIIKKALESRGVKVTSYNKPGDLKAELPAAQLDLVIISNLLLDVDALRVVSQIRSITELRRVPILLELDDAQFNQITKAFEIGINDYIISPIDQNELIARCNTQIKRKKYQDKLSSEFEENLTLVIKDKLTGAYNRRYFDIHCKQVIETSNKEQRQMAIFVFDIDHFKKINDTYGHHVGDTVIKQVAALANHSIRITDQLIRYGGEEFVVILTNIAIDNAKIVAERIRRNVSEYEFINPADNKPFQVTVSVGVTMLNQTDDDTTIFQRADANLYQAKQNGRNQVIAI